MFGKSQKGIVDEIVSHDDDDSEKSPDDIDSQLEITYPFEDKNMFFGLSLINKNDVSIVKDLDISWLSLQPHVLWLAVEQKSGKYNWKSVDNEVKWLQDLGLDVTMVVSPVINIFGENRKQVMLDLKRVMKTTKYKSMTSAFIYLLRNEKISEKYDMLPTKNDETLDKFTKFVAAAVDRYDGDGKNDMPGLKFKIRNWHLIEEWPSELSADEYVKLLKATYPVIKAEDPDAKVILAGLAGNFSQYFAFIDGYIQDLDAGVMRKNETEKGVRVSKELIAKSFWGKDLKLEYEKILRDAKEYFDVVDLHAYEPKETFIEGEIDYLRAKMKENGYEKPIWIIEGGGPFKNAEGDFGKQGDPYFGWWTEKENAEFVVKLHVLAAAKGVERDHWGLGIGEGGYWEGPWNVMGLTDSNGNKKPSYYTFKIMRNNLRDFTQVKDLSFGNVRLFDFTVPDGDVFVAWSTNPETSYADLSDKINGVSAELAFIVIGMNPSGAPNVKPDEEVSLYKVPLSLTPVFIKNVK